MLLTLGRAQSEDLSNDINALTPLSCSLLKKGRGNVLVSQINALKHAVFYKCFYCQYVCTYLALAPRAGYKNKPAAFPGRGA